jgi:serine/threonine-protein kinase
MADVFLARKHGEAGFAKLVALKLLHNHLAQRPQAVAHFLDEARLASNLNHPNIVQIIDLGKVDDAYFIAMEFIEGSDLERVIQAGRLAGRQVPLTIAMSILRRVCDGLDAAHRALGPDGTPLTIVHRDVKSGNVLISRQGQVKISDFGIAKANTQVHTTQIGETKGTPSVMAPEQRMGQAVDVRADVYAVAAMGYEVFTSAEINLDLVQLAALGIDGWPHLPPPSEVRADLPRELDTLLLGALAFQPDARPPDCRAMEEQLAAVAVRYGLVATDKDIARWLDGELGRMAPTGGALMSSSPSPGAA